MFLGLRVEQWLAFGAVAAVISTGGSLLGVVLKDYLFSRSLEKWKHKQQLEAVYQRFRDPLLLSAQELCSRLVEIVDQYPADYLSKAVLDSRPEGQVKNNSEDPHFQRYKLVSTVYRLCSFLGWLEFYRDEIVFLRSTSNEHTVRLEAAIKNLRSDFADGQLNIAADWETWKDALIFREELRAVGETMLEPHGQSRRVMGYGRFCQVFEGDNQGQQVNRWIAVVTNFLLNIPQDAPDFRRIRLLRLVTHLADLVEILDDARLDKYYSDARDRCRKLANC